MVSLNKPVPGETEDFGIAPAGEDWASLLNAALDVLADAANNVPATMAGVAADSSSAFSAQLSTKIGTEVTAQAPGIMATNPTIAAAASAAVTTNIAGRSLIQTTDPQASILLEGNDYIPLAVDFWGNPIGPTLSPIDGAFDTRGAQIVKTAAGTPDVDVPGGASATSVDIAGNRDFREANTTTGAPTKGAADLIRTAVPTKDGVVGSRVDPHRALFVSDRTGLPIRYVPDPLRIVVYGESHMEDATGGKTTAQRWSTLLQGLLTPTYPTLTVTNRATGGTVAEEAAFVRGALATSFTIPSGTIPTSGSVAVTLDTPMRTVTPAPTLSAPGRLVDATGATLVSGTATRNGADLTWTFTRTASGAAISVTRAWFVSDDFDTYQDSVLIVGSAINDSVNYPSQSLSQDIDRVVGATAAIIESVRTSVKRALLLGSLTRATDYPGSSQYVVVTEAHRELARCYPTFAACEDMRQYVNQQLIVDMGISPTASDTTSMLNDTIPTSVTQDGQHITVAASPFYAAQVKKLLTLKGFIR